MAIVAAASILETKPNVLTTFMPMHATVSSNLMGSISGMVSRASIQRCIFCTGLPENGNLRGPGPPESIKSRAGTNVGLIDAASSSNVVDFYPMPELDRLILEAQWASTSSGIDYVKHDPKVSDSNKDSDTVGLGNILRPAIVETGVKKNKKEKLGLNPQQSLASLDKGVVIRSGRPSARQRRLSSRREALGVAQVSSPCLENLAHVPTKKATRKRKLKIVGEDDDDAESDKHPKNSKDFVTFYLKQGSKQLDDVELRRLCLTMRDADHLIDYKKRLEKELAYEVSNKEWAASLSISIKELSTRLKEGNAAKKRIISANLKLVLKVAIRFRKLGMELPDLIQEGTMGLVRGVEKYDVTKGYKFSTYAYWWILQGITRSIARFSRIVRVPFHLSETICQVNRMKQESNSSLTEEEVASALKITNKRARRALQASKYRVKSTEAPVYRNSCKRNGDLNEGDNLHHFLADPNIEMQPWIMAEKGLVEEELKRLMKTKLEPREQEILELRYGINKSYDVPLSRSFIGGKCGLSRERVRQLEKAALHKLWLCRQKLSISHLLYSPEQPF